MSPLDKIKEGIQSHDMEKVIDGYEGLTGERVSREDSLLKEEMSEQTVPMHQEVPVPEVSVPEKVEVSKNHDFTAPTRKKTDQKAKFTKSQKIDVGNNTFVDDGEDHKDDVTPEVSLVPRNRNAYQEVEVACHVCGSKHSINPMFKVGQFHRCSKCVG
tara:strand:+ start:1539 stop:2012 length:474 start_codon:yes stop_codon:yes gene_type:complete